MTNKVLWCSFLGSALLLSQVGCGGVTMFQGTSAHSIVGTPPPPPKMEAPARRVEIHDNKITISEKIQFDYNRATIKSESHSLLDEVVALINQNPQLKKIAIDGHASSEGNPAANKRLSDERAKSIMAYFTGHGVAPERLSAQGWGSEKPIADNATEEGREKNRRVEFIIVEQAVTQQKVEIDPKTGKEKVLNSSTQLVESPDTAPPDPPAGSKSKSSKHGQAMKKGEKK